MTIRTIQTARDDAVAKVAAFLQLAVGYAIQGSYLTDDFAKTHAGPVVDAILVAVSEGRANTQTAYRICKHCGLRIEIRPGKSDSWLHAEGLQAGMHTCAIDPYGFQAEPAGAPCSGHPANPCNGYTLVQGATTSDLVPAEDIERIVGVARHHKVHYGRAVSSEQAVYILHSKECLASGIDLRNCRFSVALDRGIDERRWTGHEDVAVALGVWNDDLVPLKEHE